MNNFARNFSDLLRIRGVTQKQIADRLGVQPSTVNQWAKGKREPELDKLCFISYLLDTTPTELLGYNRNTFKVVLTYEIVKLVEQDKEFLQAQRKLEKELVESNKMSIIDDECEQLFRSYVKKYCEKYGYEIDWKYLDAQYNFLNKVNIDHE